MLEWQVIGLRNLYGVPGADALVIGKCTGFPALLCQRVKTERLVDAEPLRTGKPVLAVTRTGINLLDSRLHVDRFHAFAGKTARDEHLVLVDCDFHPRERTAVQAGGFLHQGIRDRVRELVGVPRENEFRAPVPQGHFPILTCGWIRVGAA